MAIQDVELVHRNGSDQPVQTGVANPLPVALSAAAALTAFAYEAVTVADSAIGLTAETYEDATKALITAETAQMRFRIDGGDPTTTAGHLLEIGDTLVLEGAAAIAAFLAIRTASTSGGVKATYFH